jgi:uncharacterized iron-regulated membrane protein
MKSSLRSILKKLHIWVGLSFGILFCLMGLSGSVIVFRHQIEDALRPRWQAKGEAPSVAVVDAAVANLRKKWPDSEVTRISFPSDPAQPLRLLVVNDDRQAQVFCDARTGEFLGTFNLPWLDTILDFHTKLLRIPSGRQWTGVIGIALFLVSLSGLAIWLLRKPDLRIAWGGPWKRINFEFHRSTGIVVNAFLVLISFTGMWMAYPDTFRQAVERMSGSPSAKLPKVKVKSSELGVPIDAFVQAAPSAFPGGKVRELRLPQGERAPVVAHMWKPGDFRPDGSSQATLDPRTARILAIDDAGNWSVSQRIIQGAKPVHYAEWGGLPLRLLWCLIGLTPSMLFVTGLLIWSGKWLPSRLRAKRIQAQDSVLAVR